MNLKILTINFGGLGDQILFLSTMAEIKKNFPEDEIFFITETRSKNIHRLTNLIKEENIICFDYKGSNRFFKACQFIKILQDGKYDYVFCTGASKFIPFILWLSGIKNRFYINNSKKYKNVYAARMLFECLRDFKAGELSVENLEQGFLDYQFVNPKVDLKVQESDLVDRALGLSQNNLRKDTVLDSQGESSREQGYRSKDAKSKAKLILVHPGVSQLSEEKGMNKAWHASGWSSLILKILQEYPQHKVILAGGPEDARICSEIISLLSEDGIYSHASSNDFEEAQDFEGRFLQMGGLLDEIKGSIQKSNFINLAGAFDDLAEFALLVSKVDIVICLDSFPMHLSYSLGKKTIALFNTTDHKKLTPNDVDLVVPIYCEKANDGQDDFDDWDVSEIIKNIATC